MHSSAIARVAASPARARLAPVSPGDSSSTLSGLSTTMNSTCASTASVVNRPSQRWELRISSIPNARVSDLTRDGSTRVAASVDRPSRPEVMHSSTQIPPRLHGRCSMPACGASTSGTPTSARKTRLHSVRESRIRVRYSNASGSCTGRAGPCRSFRMMMPVAGVPCVMPVAGVACGERACPGRPDVAGLLVIDT
jgi:hypothetical protein